MQQKVTPIIIIGIALLIAAPFFVHVAGDAQVHLAVAENFALGRPFQYNPNGEQVVASTSPFWTLWLTASYTLIGYNTPVLLKVVTFLLWLLTAYHLYKAAQEQWGFSTRLTQFTVAIWLLHTTVVANALGGLENILSAFQLLWLYRITAVQPTTASPLPTFPLTYRRATAAGLLLGWMWLTRPDGGLLGIALLGTIALHHLFSQRRAFWRITFPKFCLIPAVALLVLLPWYLYQYQLVGQFTTDSSVARLLNGRQGSIPLFNGALYLHPKAVLSLTTAFFPLMIGTAVTLWQIIKRRTTTTLLIQTPAILVLTAALIFYTFIVGAEAFGRYFLPLYPFLFLAGVNGWHQLHQQGAKRWPRLTAVYTLFAILFLIGISSFDYYRRLTNPAPTAQLFDVLYGPAHSQYYTNNLQLTNNAPSQRYEQTNQLQQQFNLSYPIKFAVTEVQLRYFVDDRIEIVSLDGRTSAIILDYVDPTTGVPNFAQYINDTQPNLVHASQWCTLGGWIAILRPTTIDENLICQWQHRAEEMRLGESFMWQEQTVTLVAPEIFHIEWPEPSS